MQAKDLIVLGDARILGRLYVDEIKTAESSTEESAPRNSRFVPVTSSASEPTEEGEIYWYYQ